MKRKPLRVLFTSVGRRVELMQAFRAAAERLEQPLVICGADMSDTAPALAYCDRYLPVCRISDPDYIPSLLRFCEEERIDALIPTIDTDLLLLSEHSGAFLVAGTRVIVCPPDSVRICRDKRKTAAFFASAGLATPVPVDDPARYDQGFPCFIKPLDGSSSIDAYRIEDAASLAAMAERIKDAIIQPYVTGEEYTVDILCDFDGRPVLITPRRRLAMRSGEVIKTRMTPDEQIREECRKLLSGFHAIGPITVQLIRGRLATDTQDRDYFIEINPRFGGGAPLSGLAGADEAEALLRILAGEAYTGEQTPLLDTAGVYCRFDQSVCTGREPVRIASLEEVIPYIKENKISGVIFDMDDTLYPETDYVKSGYRKIAESGLLGERDPRETAEALWKAFLTGEPAIDRVLSGYGLTDASGAPDPELKQRLLTIYREQEPDIRLYPEAREVLDRLKQMPGVETGLITDGRPGGQHAKIRSLGIGEDFAEILITDELAGSTGDPLLFRKPDPLSFTLMQRRMRLPAGRMVYIGDNPAKDFAAPLSLGMHALWFDNPGAYRRLFS